jgi:hypothetical protein
MPDAKPTKGRKTRQVPKEQFGLFVARKRCVACGVEKPATAEFFRVRKDLKSGLSGQCKSCRNEWKNAHERETGYTAEWVRKNGKPAPETCATKPTRHALYQQINAGAIEKARERRKEWSKRRAAERRLFMTDEQRARQREKWKRRKTWLTEAGRARQRRKQKRRRQNPDVRLTHNVARSVNAKLQQHGGRKNRSKTWEHLPYTPGELRAHLESQWSDGMTWANYGKPDETGRCWQMDHAIPCAALPHDSMDHPNFARLWALDNLRPMWADENMSKGSLWRGVRWAYADNAATRDRGFAQSRVAHIGTRGPECVSGLTHSRFFLGV